MNALVAYGSRYGSTQETAERIGTQLRAAGLDVDVLDASDVDGLDRYDVAIIGSGVYANFLRLRVTRLLHRIARQHPDLPVAVFVLGPLALEQDKPGDWSQVRSRLAKILGKVDDLDVVDSAVFGGVIDPKRMKLMFGEGEPINVRNWDDVERWTARVMQAVRHPAPA